MKITDDPNRLFQLGAHFQLNSSTLTPSVVAVYKSLVYSSRQH